MDWTSPAVLAAVIDSAGMIVAAVVAALAAWLLGRQVAKDERLKAAIAETEADIEFLLAVESRHCELHRDRTGQSGKLTVREYVRQTNRLSWSGRHTPGRVGQSVHRLALVALRRG